MTVTPQDSTAEIIDLAHRFDAVTLGYWDAPRPTAHSVKRINEHFGITLPQSLLTFARTSKNFADWFSRLGPDYESQGHIIRMNSYWRRRRPKRRLPANLIIINAGHDEDMDCIVRDSFNPQTGEYAIQYWSPDGSGGLEPAPDFANYIRKHITHWEKAVSNRKRITRPA